MAISIHPVWLIEEYVKILRSDNWFIPPSDPTTTGDGPMNMQSDM
jgi:hypothetical protein